MIEADDGGLIMYGKGIVKRREQIINIIRSVGKLDTEEAAGMFGVSKETIRQDFLYLEKKGILEKVYGGAVLKNSTNVETLLIRQNENFLAKDKIARKALEFIPDHECIIGMDTGSTVAVLGSYISQRKDLLVVSNSHRILQSLVNTDNRILALGGEYNKEEMAYYMDEFPQILKNITIDIYFIGTSGVMNRNGIYSKGFQESITKKNMISRSDKKIVLADSSKFLTTSLVEVAPWSMLDMVITDAGIPEKTRQELEKCIDVVIAK